MADTAIAITAGTGTNVDTRTEGTNGNHRQVVVLGDPATNAGVAPVDASTGLAVDVKGNALTALQLIDDAIYADDADWTDGTSKHMLIGGLYQSSPQTVTDGDVAPLQVDSNGNMIVSGTVTANLSATDNAVLDAIDSNTDNIVDALAGEYETVAASQTGQTLGATGGTGDYLSHLLVIPATTSPGNVIILDNATSITVFTGGASSVSNLVPFQIPLGMYSASGAWSVTTGANVSVVAVGNFT